MRLIIIMAVFFLTVNTNACTTFLLCKNGEIVFGRNYDWMAESGMLCSNQRGLSKKSFRKKDGNSIQWISKYGSITFNQYGKEFPTGGMNEKGLVVELMWLDGTAYPKPDERASLSNLQWIQYQLDNCSTIDEVIATNQLIRISIDDSPLHYLIADATGKAATIEFIKGELVVHKNDKLPYSVLTNNNYKYSVSQLDGLRNTDGLNNSFQSNSIGRFTMACRLIENYKENDDKIIDYAFGILDQVKQGNFTKWSIVYDIKNYAVYFKTLTNPSIKNLALNQVDFDCKSKSIAFNLSEKSSGNISAYLVPYTTELNRNILLKTAEQSKNKIAFSRFDARINYLSKCITN